MYLVEKKAHQSTKNEVQMLREQVVELERRLKESDNGHAGEMGPPNQDLSASKTACLGDISTIPSETPNVAGVVEDGL